MTHDVIVIGGGPAGYAAAMYAARAGLDALVLEKLSAGGQMASTARVENYPGFDAGIDGFDLGQRMQACAERFGARTRIATVTGVELAGQTKLVVAGGEEHRARSVIIATGARPRKLEIKNEERLSSRGVSYCATCDGAFHRGKVVAVVGGGNAAAEDALLLSRMCARVYLVHRRDSLRADQIYQAALAAAENVELVWSSAVEELTGEERLSAIRLRNLATGEARTLEVNALFVRIGQVPETALFRGQVDLDRDGYIVADETTRTNLPGVYAAGDVRTKELRQIVTAVADGACAAHCAQMDL